MRPNKTYFITSYMEFLLLEGLRCEETYVGDASRFLRFLLENTTTEVISEFIEKSGNTPASRRRISSSINRFLKFAQNDLQIANPQLIVYTKDQEA